MDIAVDGLVAQHEVIGLVDSHTESLADLHDGVTEDRVYEAVTGVAVEMVRLAVGEDRRPEHDHEAEVGVQVGKAG